jgi:hypothetical protein
MTHFLWVEDFNVSETKRSENIVSSTVSSVFGSILNNAELSARLAEEDENDAQDFLEEKGIFLKLNLLEALEFINDPKELAKIDFVVLDVDMPLENGQRDNNNYLSSLIERCPPEDALRKIAGYHIYTELVIELGFPKKHILFCSNHASYFEELKNKFSSANIKPPISPNPNEPFLRKEDKEFINQWLDNAHSDYFVLRRGIIDACNYLENKTSDAELKEYFFGLKRYLPLKKPTPTEKKSIYLHLARAIVHDWDDKGRIPERRNDPVKNTLGWLLNNARNWLAHDSLLKNFDEKTIAFIFLINVRMLISLDNNKLENFELKLLSIFERTNASEADILCNIKLFYKEAIEVCENNSVPFINRFYTQMVNDFHEKPIESCNYTKLLFRFFMFAIYQHKSSFPKLINTNNPNSPFLDYQVKFTRQENLPFYLLEFEKYFYPLTIGTAYLQP